MTELSNDDIKNKTLIWCRKLLNNGIFSNDNYNDCINSYSNLGEGELPAEFEVPRTGIKHNYALYNKNERDLDKTLLNQDNSLTMISNQQGLYLGINENGNLYFEKDYTREGVRQDYLEWSFIHQTDEKFAIMCIGTQTYLHTDGNLNVMAKSDTLNPSSTWRIKTRGGKQYFESLAHKNHFFSYQIIENNIYFKVIKDNKSNNYFNVLTINKNSNSPYQVFLGLDLITKKNKVLQQYEIYSKGNKVIEVEIYILNYILSKVREKFTKIIDHVKLNFKNNNKEYKGLYAKNKRDIDRIDSFRKSLSLSNTDNLKFDEYSSNIQAIESRLGTSSLVNVNETDIKKVIRKINDKKQKMELFINKLILERSKFVQSEIKNEKTINNIVNLFIKEAEEELDKVTLQVTQNNRILEKQINKINGIKESTYFKKNKMSKDKDNHLIAKVNSDLTIKREKSIKYYMNIYLIGIVILAALSLMLLYSIIIKFRENF
tara:strand:+ start:3549 stop:5012 length:1464 start_codon:yes stop_codon:yes gene_type:complete